MTAENFVYWLNGFLEIGNPEVITKGQIQIIKDHIGLVLNKVTPNRTLYDWKEFNYTNKEPVTFNPVLPMNCASC